MDPLLSTPLVILGIFALSLGVRWLMNKGHEMANRRKVRIAPWVTGEYPAGPAQREFLESCYTAEREDALSRARLETVVQISEYRRRGGSHV